MSDGYTYVNRRGQRYFLQSKPDGKGVPRYSFTMKETQTPVARVPEGFEVREDPDNAQVTLRKIKPTPILPEERQLLESIIRQETKDLHYIVDVQGSSLVVYTADAVGEGLLDEWKRFIPMTPKAVRDLQDRYLRDARYDKMLRFTLSDAKARLFGAERWCFLGSIDNWYSLDWSRPLEDLAREYVPHLGKESFFELM